MAAEDGPEVGREEGREVGRAEGKAPGVNEPDRWPKPPSVTPCSLRQSTYALNEDDEGEDDEADGDDGDDEPHAVKVSATAEAATRRMLARGKEAQLLPKRDGARYRPGAWDYLLRT